MIWGSFGGGGRLPVKAKSDQKLADAKITTVSMNFGTKVISVLRIYKDLNFLNLSKNYDISLTDNYNFIDIKIIMIDEY